MTRPACRGPRSAPATRRRQPKGHRLQRLLAAVPVQHLYARCYTSWVPTTRPRHTITETDQVARALDEAATVWPDLGESRSQLLLRLIEEGYQAILEGRQRRAAQRRTVIRRTSGVLTGAYEDGYLARLRDEWPA